MSIPSQRKLARSEWKRAKKCFWTLKHVQLLIWWSAWGYASGRLFTHRQDFCQSSMNRPAMMSRVYAMCLTVTQLSSITIRWFPSTWASVVADFGRVICSALPSPLKISNPLLYGRITERTLTTCFESPYHDFIPFLWRYLTTAFGSFLYIFYCGSYWVKWWVCHLHTNKMTQEIWNFRYTYIWCPALPLCSRNKTWMRSRELSTWLWRLFY